ncbi:putative polypeptide N-acetylgalactosaminyltransferase 9 isoform X2 [Uranotaenia lowii]|uniref:putative polypeptide N-acetylgalactosaminyltransferase 9 isoform X2 n=1 Tax=Uranotaenia lowii TaxID=190385 RepID=UPI00247A7027|nr:putative polypeptide N-acetylgalactosaminyltransferase 9 isoform X2 [Uranotaenia lowii]
MNPEKSVTVFPFKLVRYNKLNDDFLAVLDEPPPGDMGNPVIINTNRSNDLQLQIQLGWDTQGLNQYASDLVSVFRRLPDIRDPWCKVPNRFQEDLPPASIVIVFFNEAWSVLVRTVQSILSRTPSELIEEIILVDDCSTMAHLKTQLDDYFRPYKLVRIIRAKERQGLIRARILGAKSARSQIITFLDAHCEVIVGWLEAQLDLVVKNPTAIAVPSIDWIHEDTMALNARDSQQYFGSFDWTLNFQWKSRSVKKVRAENPVAPFDTPVMAGGLFTINRTFFEWLGWYDEGFEVYGAENLELSFKAWMCGGSMKIVPCSRVAHIQKRGHPYMKYSGYGSVQKNTIRLAEVWLDEYADYYYESFGGRRFLGEFGDVSSRKLLRKNLNCKSFRWYLDTVFPEQFNPERAIGRGEFRVEINPGEIRCLEWPPDLKRQGVDRCRGRGNHQLWFYTPEGEVTREDHCLDYDGKKLEMIRCHGMRGNQEFRYSKPFQQFKHSLSGLCLGWGETHLVMDICDSDNKRQIWVMEHFNASNVKVAIPR